MPVPIKGLIDFDVANWQRAEAETFGFAGGVLPAENQYAFQFYNAENIDDFVTNYMRTQAIWNPSKSDAENIAINRGIFDGYKKAPPGVAFASKLGSGMKTIHVYNDHPDFYPNGHFDEVFYKSTLVHETIHIISSKSVGFQQYSKTASIPYDWDEAVTDQLAEIMAKKLFGADYPFRTSYYDDSSIRSQQLRTRMNTTFAAQFAEIQNAYLHDASKLTEILARKSADGVRTLGQVANDLAADEVDLAFRKNVAGVISNLSLTKGETALGNALESYGLRRDSVIKINDFLKAQVGATVNLVVYGSSTRTDYEAAYRVAYPGLPQEAAVPNVFRSGGLIYFSRTKEMDEANSAAKTAILNQSKELVRTAAFSALVENYIKTVLPDSFLAKNPERLRQVADLITLDNISKSGSPALPVKAAFPAVDADGISSLKSLLVDSSAENVKKILSSESAPAWWKPKEGLAGAVVTENWLAPRLQDLTAAARLAPAGDPSFNYARQLIVQLQGDDVSFQSARDLFLKHPRNTDWIQLKDNAWGASAIGFDAGGNSVVASKSPLSLSADGRVRIVVVGHGMLDANGVASLGGKSAEQIISGLRGMLDAIPKEHIKGLRVELLGCDLAQSTLLVNDTLPGKVANFLLDYGIQKGIDKSAISLTAREAAVRVNELGKKEVLTVDGWQSKEQMIASDELHKVELNWDSLHAPRSQATELALLGQQAKLASQEWNTVVADLRQQRGLSGDWVAWADRANGHSDTEVHFVNTKDGRQLWIDSQNERITKFKDLTQSVAEGAAQRFHFDKASNSAKAMAGVDSDTSFSTLSFAFLAQMLINGLPGSEASTAVKTAAALQLTQLSLDIGGQTASLALDVAKTVIKTEVGVVFRTAGTIAKGIPYVSAILGLANLGASGAVLAETSDPVGRAVAIANVTTAAVSVVVDGAALVAGAVGAATVSAVLGPIAVPLAGIGIGVVALVEAYEKLKVQTNEAITLFNHLYKAAETPFSDDKDAKLQRADPYAVIRRIDFRDSSYEFGSVLVAKTKNRSDSNWHGANWRRVRVNGVWTNLIYTDSVGHDYDPIVFSEATSFSVFSKYGKGGAQAMGDSMKESKTLVLPSAVGFNLGWSLIQSPGISINDDADGIRVLRTNFGKDSDEFMPFQVPSGEMAIGELKVASRWTPVDVQMDGQRRTIVVPSVADGDRRGNLSYRLIGGGGTTIVVLSVYSTSLKLEASDASTERWVIDINNMSRSSQLDGDQLKLSGFKTNVLKDIHFDARHLYVAEQTIELLGNNLPKIILRQSLDDHSTLLLTVDMKEQTKTVSLLVALEDGFDFNVDYFRSLYGNSTVAEALPDNVVPVVLAKGNAAGTGSYDRTEGTFSGVLNSGSGAMARTEVLHQQPGGPLVRFSLPGAASVLPTADGNFAVQGGLTGSGFTANYAGTLSYRLEAGVVRPSVSVGNVVFTDQDPASRMLVDGLVQAVLNKQPGVFANFLAQNFSQTGADGGKLRFEGTITGAGTNGVAYVFRPKADNNYAVAGLSWDAGKVNYDFQTALSLLKVDALAAGADAAAAVTLSTRNGALDPMRQLGLVARDVLVQLPPGARQWTLDDSFAGSKRISILPSYAAAEPVTIVLNQAGAQSNYRWDVVDRDLVLVAGATAVRIVGGADAGQLAKLRFQFGGGTVVPGQALQATLPGVQTHLGWLSADDKEVVVESPTVYPSFGDTLPPNVHNLTFEHDEVVAFAPPRVGKGNELDNVLTGNGGSVVLWGFGGHDVLDGGRGGSDVLVGGTGDDSYFINLSGDVVQELAGEGNDTVNARASYVLPNNVENLRLLGDEALNGTGNALDNDLQGNLANNTLDGAGGRDHLAGGAGNDQLIGRMADSRSVTNLVTNGSFEVEYAFGAGWGGAISGISEWRNGPGGYIEVMNGAQAGVARDDGNNYVELDYGGAVDVLTHPVITTLGKSYMLKFDIATRGGYPDESVQVFWGGQLVDTQKSAGTSWRTVSVVLDGKGGSAELKLAELVAENNSIGPFIDNVRFYQLETGSSYDGGAGVDTLDFGRDAGLGSTGTYVGGIDASLAGGWVSRGGNYSAVTGIEKIVGTQTGDTLVGSAGNDTLDGGDSSSDHPDVLAGGVGNDTYVLHHTWDVARENPGGGTDTIVGFFDTTLPVNFENLTLAGSDNLRGAGNAEGNTITGNSGDNTIDGGAGADSMAGGAGNDSYVVDRADDVVVEKVGEGVDTVMAGASYRLSNNVENLTLTGAGDLRGEGNGLNNILTGNAGNNDLDGQGGHDTVYGMGGDDHLFAGAVSADAHNLLEINVNGALINSGSFEDGWLWSDTAAVVRTDSRAPDGRSYLELVRNIQGLGLRGGYADTTVVTEKGGDYYLSFVIASKATAAHVKVFWNGVEIANPERDNAGFSTRPSGLALDQSWGLADYSGRRVMVKVRGTGGADKLSFVADSNEVSGAGQGPLLDDVKIVAAGGSTYDGGAGYDVLDYSKMPFSTNVVGIVADLVLGQVRTQSGIDTVIGIERVVGSGGMDFLRGGAGNDHLFGGNGDDVLEGRDGNDILVGGAGFDILDGGAGDDDMRFAMGSGIDTVQQSAGADTITIEGWPARYGQHLFFLRSGDDLLIGKFIPLHADIIENLRRDEVVVKNWFAASTPYRPTLRVFTPQEQTAESPLVPAGTTPGTYVTWSVPSDVQSKESVLASMRRQQAPSLSPAAQGGRALVEAMAGWNPPPAIDARAAAPAAFAAVQLAVPAH